jgi:hypothetical protein
LTPLGEGDGAIDFEFLAAVEMALLIEVVVNLSMHRSEFL